MVTVRPSLLLLGSLVLGACFSPAREPDCLFDGTCECKSNLHCPTDRVCVNGRCRVPVDAGLATACNLPDSTGRDLPHALDHARSAGQIVF